MGCVKMMANQYKVSLAILVKLAIPTQKLAKEINAYKSLPRNGLK